MKFTLYLLFFSSLILHSQTAIKTTLIQKQPLQVSTFIDTDGIETLYYLNNNTLTKQTASQTLQYSNLQLGHIHKVNTFNPLRLNVFYKNFNTVMILDNRLAEIYKIDFNTITPYRNPTYISTGYDTTLWVFNENTQQLELFDYKTNTLRASSSPINSEVLDMVSNYNWCWLLTSEFLYKFNYVGSLVQKIKNEGFTDIKESNENLILKKNNSLFYLKKGTKIFNKINLSDLLIKQFLLTNQTLYIYDLKNLNQFHLITP
ncbi:hypothetical protein FNB79_02410 [Formosa sediminum]|uniref:WD40 repeat domain-containing protein n=1 Tax=Formosa sediminum TaxID=2594004 RepID=A0A516GN01_9FLAO|nr:hypothetical protein [Formosa sediminum]QDO92873.1 hypothetical protein FNB79_02410 [Formosa sediminum]